MSTKNIIINDYNFTWRITIPEHFVEVTKHLNLLKQNSTAISFSLKNSS